VKNETCEKIKNDLRQIRVLSHQIDCVIVARDKRIERLKHTQDEKEKARLQAIIGTINVDKLIAQANSLEQEYMGLINRLDNIDRTIIYDGYILGTPYWKIAKKIGYSEANVQKRALAAIEQIARMK
jgi:DNA-directed RNA polymerase specialized sigma24 family protein